MIPDFLETAYEEAVHFECILLTPFWIYNILLLLLEYSVKEEDNEELGESADAEAVLGLEME